MHIVFISDTHNRHGELIIPECDVLVHSGDYTSIGTPSEIISYFTWLCDQKQAKHKVFIEGNHDFHADPTRPKRMFERFPNASTYEAFIEELVLWKDKFQENNIHRLLNSEVIIDGVKFWGSPYTPAFHGWGFNSTSIKLEENWKQCPKDVDVLITHGPAYDRLDKCRSGDSAGDIWINELVREVKPYIHTFGHIHESAGSCLVGLTGREKQTLTLNSSSMDEYYKISNKPFQVILEKEIEYCELLYN